MTFSERTKMSKIICINSENGESDHYHYMNWSTSSGLCSNCSKELNSLEGVKELRSKGDDYLVPEFMRKYILEKVRNN